MAEGAEDRQLMGTVMINFGSLCLILGQHEKMIGLLEQGSAIKNHQSWATGSSCADFTGCYQAMGRYEKAIKLREQGVVISSKFEDLGCICELMLTLRGLGECFALIGNYAQAIKHHQKITANR